MAGSHQPSGCPRRLTIEFKRNLRVFVMLAQMCFKSSTVYRSNWIAGQLAKLIGYASDYAVLGLLMLQFKSIAGWTLPDLLFLHSVYIISWTIAGSFVIGLSVEYYVAEGNLDSVLLKPVNSLVNLSGQNFATDYLSQSLLGFFVLFVSGNMLGVEWGFDAIARLGLVILCSIIMQAALIILIYDVCFFTVRGHTIADTIGNFRAFAQWPISIYDTALRILLTFVIPVAFINYYPAGMFLDRAEYIPLRPLVAASPLVAIGLLAFSIWFWHRGINSYQSTGS